MAASRRALNEPHSRRPLHSLSPHGPADCLRDRRLHHVGARDSQRPFVPARAAAHLRVRWLLDTALRVAYASVDDAGQPLEVELGAPEAAGGEVHLLVVGVQEASRGVVALLGRGGRAAARVGQVGEGRRRRGGGRTGGAQGAGPM